MKDFETNPFETAGALISGRVEAFTEGIEGVSNVVRLFLPELEQETRSNEVEALGMSALEASMPENSTAVAEAAVQPVEAKIYDWAAYREKHSPQLQSQAETDLAVSNEQAAQTVEVEVTDLDAFREQKRLKIQSRHDAAVENAKAQLIEFKDVL